MQNEAVVQTGPTVTITINSEEFDIHRGRQSVEDIKKLGNVPLAHDLDQIVDGELVPLPDDGSVTIKGEEIFVSHVKDGGAA